MWQYNSTAEFYHHGVVGMKWGVRRYQNKDGTLTSKGRTRYQKEAQSLEKQIKKERADIAYLRETWREEGYSKKDIALGLEEYELSLVNMQKKLREIDKILADGRVTNAKIEKLQRRIESSKQEGLAVADKKRAAIQKDIDSFSPFLETGIMDKNGRLMLSPEDVVKSVDALEKLKNQV